MARSGDTVGPWTLLGPLGRGGNATVWKAAGADGSEVALKLINANKVEREPYQRFVREIAFLREHRDVPGILPVLDAHLPNAPTRADQPWLAMPVARRVSVALATASLPEIVEAVAVFAETLASLQDDFDIAHRDIKPGNLYELDGKWLIGDFGLVALPGAEPLTVDGRQVGPAHYTAYEMIVSPTTSDPHLADVYSLGKTLWVLATGQRFPPEGHQPVGTRGFEVGNFRPHPHASALDQEIDLMTRLHPEERPSKRQVARDLRSWQELSASPVEFDVSKARAQLVRRLKSAIAEQDTQDQNKEFALSAVRRLQKQTAPLNAGLKSLYPRAQIDRADDAMTRNILTSRIYGASNILRWQRCTLLLPLQQSMTAALRFSRSIELFSNGQLVVRVLIDVGPEGVMGNYFTWDSQARTVPVGSIEADQLIDALTPEVADALRQGIDVFVEHLPESEDASGN